MAMKSLKELGILDSQFEVQASPPIPPELGGVQRRDDYVFRRDSVMSMCMFFDLSQGADEMSSVYRAMMIHGPKGSGKTSFIEQWHERLGLKLYTINCHGRVEPENWIGGLGVNEAGALVWRDGPLLQAAREGASILFNELNTVEPDVAIALNDLAQPGSSITTELGEVINPKPGFRVFATVNPPRGIYMGRKPLDSSTRRRFLHVEMDYPEAEVEVRIVTGVLLQGQMPEADARMFAKRMVAVATSVRAASVEKSDAANAIPETISTDELKKWAVMWMKMHGQPDALTKSLDFALLTGVAPKVRDAILQHVRTTMGTTTAL